MLGQQWITGAQVKTRPNLQGIPDNIIEDCARLASSLLFTLSGRKYPGPSQVTLRPCARPRSFNPGIWREILGAYGWGGAWDAWGGWGTCPTGDPDNHSECYGDFGITLPTTPIRSVEAVTIDGIALDPSVYFVADTRTLVRTDGLVWPTCQIMSLPLGQSGTWSIDLTFGDDPPYEGVSAAATLAAELAKAHADRPNKLPQRLTSITRQDVSMAVLDPMQFLMKPGMPLTGIWEVDLFIRSTNPDGQRVPPAVMSPDRQKFSQPGVYVPPRP